MKDHLAIKKSYIQFLEELGLIDINLSVSADELMNDPNKVQVVRDHLAKRRVGSSILDVHRWLSNLLDDYPKIEINIDDFVENEVNYRITDETYIWHPSLLAFLEMKGIPINVAQAFFKQARIYDTEDKKAFYSLIHRNEEEGVIVSSKTGQSVIGVNDITFMDGAVYGKGGIHIFRNAFDYLSALILVNDGRRFKNDALILNCYSNLDKAAPHMRRYEYKYIYPMQDKLELDGRSYQSVFSWMPNDKIGKQATKALNDFLKTEMGIEHVPMNKTYAPYIDISAFHQVKLGLVA